MDTWYKLPVAETIEKLNTDLHNGLTSAEVEQRHSQFGKNELVERGAKSPWKILLEQLSGIMVVMLIVSSIISAILGEYTDAIVILVIVILNSILGFTQEYQAERAMAALKRMAVPHVRVRRDGHLREIEAVELVPGDIVLLEAGNSIPADARLVESVNLRVQEAVLTGESEPVEKETTPIDKDNLTVGDRRNMVHMGTIATYGRGTAVIVETGMRTELGKIAEMIQGVSGEKTPLQRRLEQLGRGLAIAALGIVALVFLFGILRGEDLKIMFQTAISMAVAAVPEGLPAVVTIALALGAQRMLKRNALIRQLPAVETLGSVTVICSDKTGTLTQNVMTVTVLDVAGNRLDLKEKLQNFSPSISKEEKAGAVLLDKPAVSMLVAGGALCNDAILEQSDSPDKGFIAVGDPTEGALVIAAARSGIWKEDLEQEMPRVAEVPFDSDRKRMTTIHALQAGKLSACFDHLECLPEMQRGENNLVLTKGAVDGLLEVSDRVWVEGCAQPLDNGWKKRIYDANNQMAQNGMRVLGLALRLQPANDTRSKAESVENNLVFIGMFGMIDPARPEVKDAVYTSQTAGIRPIMITGDHPLTALHIAGELGITGGKQVMTGQDLANVEVNELERVVEDVSVYARVSPEHKLKIVNALQNKGHIVAMTGDGVNDAPALKKSDIGVAMGITGTDVSKEASDMILLDDNFATIVAAVEEGRRIYDNIRKFIRYTMTSNAGEVWVMLLGPFLGLGLPLTPLQILWVNLVTDGLPGLALAIEPAERNTMQRKPHPPGENIFGRGMARDILWVGLLMGLVSLAAGLIYRNIGNPNWQTILFTTLTLSQMGNALAIRSERYSLFQIGLFSNKAMLGAVLLTLVLQLMVIYVPFFQGIFETNALTIGNLAISLLLSLVVFASIEIFKYFMRRRSE